MTKTKQMQSQNTSLFRTLVLLSIPTVLEQVLSTLLQYVDTAMVGHLGEQATAAVSTTTTITWLVNSVPGAIGTAVLVLISRAAGAGDKAQVKKLAEQGLFLAVSAGVALTGVSLALSPWIPVWMGAEAAVQPNASRYFFIVSVPLLFRCVSSVMGSALRGVQNTKTPMLISVAENGLNILLNSILIYGLDLGVTGAAIASAVAYTLSGVLMFAACRKNKQLCWQWRTFSLSPKLLKACANLGVPVLGSSMVSCLGYVVFASLVSGMGTTVFAAHSIAVTAETIFYVPGYGLRTAASTLIGNARGEGNTEKLKSVARLSVLLTVGMMCISGVALFFGAQALMHLFSPSAAVVELGAQMLRLVALSEPFYGLMIVLEGIFYGLGRTRYAFFAEAFGMWCVRILFTALCVNVWGLGLRAVWYCMIADNVCKAVLFAVPFLKKRSRERLLSTRESKSPKG
ncbi:MAG TPA: MATE family efflux transporter [Candidatus Scubalenecus merdavium]|uniref:Probable multidrug resistance protein NorM n=1 Tax=Candidatus Scybalenecus merdavium TaxID=2840939 RepID=A0A9D1MVE5_9FIRM|nr:MATE family efflux transporter [Candidatus Scubalenecus merdavium]